MSIIRDFANNIEDSLFDNITANLVTGYTTDIETLISDSITPDLSLEAIKSRVVTGNVTINFPTGGNGVCHILLKADGAGPYTVTLNANVKAVGSIPDLVANTNYIAMIIRETSSYTIIQIQEISA